MKKEIRKEKKRSRLIKRLLKKLKFLRKIRKSTGNYDSEMLLPRNIRRNRCRNIIREDGLNKVNKRLKYYWKDVQAGVTKL